MTYLSGWGQFSIFLRHYRKYVSQKAQKVNITYICIDFQTLFIV